MSEFGIFNDEGKVEGDFCSMAEAQAPIDADPETYEGCYAAECCHDHPEYEKDNCEDCNAAAAAEEEEEADHADE
jgi:hypothetical protein